MRGRGWAGRRGFPRVKPAPAGKPPPHLTGRCRLEIHRRVAQRLRLQTNYLLSSDHECFFFGTLTTLIFESVIYLTPFSRNLPLRIHEFPEFQVSYVVLRML